MDGNSDLPAKRGKAEVALPEDVIDRVKEFLAGSRAQSTLRSYASSWRKFEKWCDKHKREPLPATAETLAGFVASCNNSPRTIGKHLSAIGLAHRSAGLPDLTRSEAVRAVLAGRERLEGVALKQAKPVRRKELLAVVDALDRDTLVGCRDTALFLFFWAGGFRRETVATVQLAHLEFYENGMGVNVPKSKTDQEGKGKYTKIARAWRGRFVSPYCPVANVERWIEEAQLSNGALFRSIDRWGNVRDSLSEHGIWQIVRRYFDTTPHGFRAGLVTDLSHEGVPDVKIREITWHTSDSTLARYQRGAGEWIDLGL